MITGKQFARIDNCPESLAFVASQSSLSAAWANCVRRDWLLAFALKARLATKAQYVRIAVGEAETVLPIWTQKHPTDGRPAAAIEVAKIWLEKPTEENKQRAAKSAYAAYAAAANEAASASFYAAATSVCAANAAHATDSVYAANAANSTVYHAAVAHAAAYAQAATDDKLAFCRAQCDRIRAIIPNPFVAAANVAPGRASVEAEDCEPERTIT